jgi:hypothetical protein
MADNTTPPKPQYDAGHVPITEEFDSPKRSLPPAVPVVIALVVVAIVVGVIAFVERSKPVAQGGIDSVYASQPANMTNTMVALQVTVSNVGDKALYIKSITANLKTDQGDQSDDAASASDYDRYFTAYPELRQHSTQPLTVETKIMQGAEQKGYCPGVVSGHRAAVQRSQGSQCDNRALRSEPDCAAREKRCG